MDKNKKTKLIYELLAVIVVAIAILVVIVVKTSKTDTPEVIDNTPEDTVPIEIKEEYKEYAELWDANHNINEDYVGDIVFDSGLINVSFVQAKSVYKDDGSFYTFYTESGRKVDESEASYYTGNDVYIWTYWKTGEYDYNDNGGSTFMDYRNVLDDENLIVYGHHFSVWNDETRSKAFTPLEQLMEEENYENNKYVTLILENQIRKYEIAYVYIFDATKDSSFNNLQYFRTNYNYDFYNYNAYDPNYYQDYIDSVEEVKLYDTNVKLTTQDKTLTLQTCVSGHTGELFEIVVLKELSTEIYR